MRRLAGNDPEVNEEWITDKDRFAFRYAQRRRPAHPPAWSATRTASCARRRGPRPSPSRPAAWRAAGAPACSPVAGVTAEDAYAYAKFARVALGTNDIDFRARPLSAEEAAFLAAEVVLAPSGHRTPTSRPRPTVVLAGLEPEDEAGTIFLRLRKASPARAPASSRSRRTPRAGCAR